MKENSKFINQEEKMSNLKTKETLEIETTKENKREQKKPKKRKTNQQKWTYNI